MSFLREQKKRHASSSCASDEENCPTKLLSLGCSFQKGGGTHVHNPSTSGGRRTPETIKASLEYFPNFKPARDTQQKVEGGQNEAGGALPFTDCSGATSHR